jgi:hypothetical protein
MVWLIQANAVMLLISFVIFRVAFNVYVMWHILFQSWARLQHLLEPGVTPVRRLHFYIPLLHLTQRTLALFSLGGSSEYVRIVILTCSRPYSYQLGTIQFPLGKRSQAYVTMCLAINRFGLFKSSQRSFAR